METILQLLEDYRPIKNTLHENKPFEYHLMNKKVIKTLLTVSLQLNIILHEPTDLCIREEEG